MAVHELPLDFGRTSAWATARTSSVGVEKVESTSAVVSAFARVMATHQRAERVFVLVREKDDVKVAVVDAKRTSVEFRPFSPGNNVDPSFHPVCQSGVTVGRLSAATEFPESSRFAPLDVELVVDPTERVASIVYRSDLLEGVSAERLLTQTACELSGEVPERELAGANATAVPRREEACLHDLLVESATKNPEAVAMRYDLARTPTTYGGLLGAIARVAEKISPVEPDERVALLVAREPSMIVAVFATLVAGAAYVPLEPDYPPQRLETVVEDASARIVVTQRRFADLVSWGAEVVTCDDEEVPRHDPEGPARARMARGDAVRSHHLAYVFYTSGTTGKPKGVCVEHRGVARRAAWFQRRYPLSPGDAMLVKTTYTFGISEFELFWPTTVGAELLIARPDGHKIASYVAQLSKHASAFCFVPSALAAVADAARDECEPSDYDIKVAISCGEPLSAATAAAFFMAFGGRVLSNVYGPTEADMTFFEIKSLEEAKALRRAPPIGRPMDNVVVYLLDDALQHVPLGAPGHLHFGAPAPARGYLGLPDLNEKCWVDNPFYPPPPPPFSPKDDDEKVPPCPKLYATGDLARWLPSGQLGFCGRVDAGQIKLRGFRIELDDVSAALNAHPDVEVAAAKVVDPDTPRARLVGYVVSAAAAAAAAKQKPRLIVEKTTAAAAVVEPSSLATDALERAKEMLPAYAVPSVVVELSRLPVTARGKLDRAALPTPAATRADEDDFVECVSATERRIEACWQAVLGLDPTTPISATADFVTLGGNSLLAGRATTKLRHDLGGVQLPGTAMYMYPTIAELAAFADAQPTSHSAAKLAQEEEENQDENVEYYAGHSSTAPGAVVGQVLAVIFALCCSDLLRTLPTAVVAWRAYQRRGALYAACVVAPACSLATPVVLGMIAVLANRLAAPRWRKKSRKRIKLWSREYLGWLVAKHATSEGAAAVSTLFGGTSLESLFYRLCGATVGEGVVFESGCVLEDPQCVRVGDGVRVGRHSRVSAHFFQDGYLVLSRTTLEPRSRTHPRSCLGAGATLPAGKTLGALAAAGAGAVLGAEDLDDDDDGGGGGGGGDDHRRDDDADVARGKQKKPVVLRLPPERRRSTLAVEDEGVYLVVGVPSILACEACATLVAILAARASYDAIGFVPPPPSSYLRLLFVAWVFRLVQCEAFFATCVAVKRFVIGTFVEGDEKGESPVRRWLWDRLAHHGLFEAATRPYVNTEVLAAKFRLLGAKIGRRVNVDAFDCVEFDLVEVGDEVVFGSCVALVPYLPGCGASKKISIRRGANVLDHAVLLPGVIVEEAAITGTDTLGPRDWVFPAGTVSTGRVKGEPVTLKFSGDVEAGTSRLPAKDKARVLKALRRHRDPATFYAFNAFCVAAAALLEPLDALRALAPLLAYREVGLLAAVVAFPAIECLAVAAVVAAKHAVVGDFEEIDTEYYSDLHVRWVFLMACASAIDHPLDAVQGTFLAPMLFRAMGATVGRDCCLFYAAALEFDLLTIGDFATTGDGSDLTCHTVENMVVKFAKVTIGDGCCLNANAICMPGATMDRRSTVLEGSQVLKGETVGPREVWRGLPAAKIGDNVDLDRALVLRDDDDDDDDDKNAAAAAAAPKKDDDEDDDAMIAALAGVLGISAAAATDLLAANERGEPRAARVFHQLARLGRRLDREPKPLAPLARRPPHLRPRRLAKTLGIPVDDARALVRDWRDADPRAEATVEDARLRLFAAFAGLDGPDAARSVFRQAANGDEDAANLVHAYRHSGGGGGNRIAAAASSGGGPAFKGPPASSEGPPASEGPGSSRSARRAGHNKRHPPWLPRVPPPPLVPPPRVHPGGPPAPEQQREPRGDPYYRDAALFLAGGLAVSFFINLAFLLKYTSA
ncbi:hypothetical protein CTAYLR_006155 [Chrysophaeum taylorii]|uniref:Carrier domain-containing protein n=1 Tax=Chrysophaeum taylorii TaxID=2483200 RepID=A0AAD7UP77_9STRA|nr:hypothetical protein CTAYLR_006155 [Chrysophaeum taylorii]